MANFNNSNHAFVRRFARNRLALAGLFFLAILVVLVALAPQLYPGDPFAIVDKPFLRPFDKYLLGTDALGRDIAAGIVHGGQTSLIIGVAATLAALLIGTILGALAGFYRGRTDHVLMRFTEFFQTIPSFLFAIVLVAIMSPSLKSVTIAIVVVSWPPIVRLVRAEFISLREREFIQACICLGLDDRSIAAGFVVFRLLHDQGFTTHLNDIADAQFLCGFHKSSGIGLSMQYVRRAVCGETRILAVLPFVRAKRHQRASEIVLLGKGSAPLCGGIAP